MNKIISIGYLGLMKCYLNIEEDDAILRYCESESITLDEFNEDSYLSIETIEFYNEFEAYSIWT